MRTKWLRFTPYVVAGIVLVLLPPVLPNYILLLLTSMIIFSIYVSSANFVSGYGGLITFGQAMFWGSAAYVVAILSTRGITENFYLLALVSLIVVVVIAAVIGVLALRVPGLYFLILTFAFGVMIWSIAMYPVQSITKGYDGIAGILRPDLGIPVSMGNSLNFYYLVLVISAVCFLIIYRILKSPFGAAMVGIRDNEHRMRALGYNIFMHKYICWIIGAVIAGVGGFLWAYYDGYISPTELSWLWSASPVIVAMIGGSGTFWGPVFGAIVFIGLRYYVSIYTMYWYGIMGILFILVVLYFPGGITGGLMQLQRRLRLGSAKR